MDVSILTRRIREERDVVGARRLAREIAAALGFGGQDLTRIATAASEIARNTFAYAGGGLVEYRVEGLPSRRSLVVRFVDQGPGIQDVEEVLSGAYRSPTGMGLGMSGSKKIMDEFRVESVVGQGTTVVMSKRLPPSAPAIGAEEAAMLARRIEGEPERDAYGEVQEQNRELLMAIQELQTRQQQLLDLNRELEDTNRGVVALYAELDDRVEQLRRANALRAQFTSYLSHEFRTPLDSMIALSAILLDRADGDLSEEQEKQVGYIRRSARDLLDMVDDMLDTARVESGQVLVRPDDFSVAELFNALRATLRPLLTSERVSLVFEEPRLTAGMRTDEAKVSQILRNLIANALKFTERGEIRVSADASESGEEVVFRVSDTGIGVSAEDQQRIFEDYAQVDGAVQRRVRGTGLGLPLSRKLAELLGGELSISSSPGVGSVFMLTIPRVYAGMEEPASEGATK